MKTQAWYAVLVGVKDDAGNTYTRVYVRGEKRIGKAAFRAFALGDMLSTVNDRQYDGLAEWSSLGITGWSVQDVPPQYVQENRLYELTSHKEDGSRR